MTEIHGLRIGLFVAFLVAGLQLPLSCGGAQKPPANAKEAIELCAQATALSPEVQTQAAKVGREPIDFTRQICSAVILAAQVVEANLPKSPGGAAGGASIPITQASAGSSP